MDKTLIKGLMEKWMKLQDKVEEAKAEADSVWAEIEAARGGESVKPSKASKSKPVKKDGRAARGSVALAIQKALDTGKEFGVKEVLAIIEESGGTANAGSINAALGKMLEAEKIKRPSRGRYCKL